MKFIHRLYGLEQTHIMILQTEQFVAEHVMNMIPKHILIIGFMFYGESSSMLIPGFKDGHEFGKQMNCKGLGLKIALIDKGFKSLNE